MEKDFKEEGSFRPKLLLIKGTACTDCLFGYDDTMPIIECDIYSNKPSCVYYDVKCEKYMQDADKVVVEDGQK